MTQKTEHSEISPSGVKRTVFGCPGCRRMCRGIEDKPSIYAEEGTAAHFVADHCLKVKCKTSDLADGVDTFTAPETKKYVSQEMFDHVQTYLDVVNGDFENGMSFGAEEEMDLGWIYPGMKGTTDAFNGSFMELLRVYDLKYGAGVLVEPEGNEQGMLYALGKLGPDNPEGYEEVEIVIVQPRAYHPDGPVRRWRISVASLYAWAEQFKTLAKATEDPNAPLKSGEHCQFCPASAQCPEIVVAARESAMIEFGLDAAVDEGLTNVTLPDPELLSIEQVAKVLDFTKILSSWSKDVESFIHAKMDSGVTVPGYKLVKKKANRKWKDEQAVIDTFDLEFSIYNDPELRTPAQMEKLIGIDKKALAAFWEKPDGGSVIAPESDKRKAIEPSAVNDFLE